MARFHLHPLINNIAFPIMKSESSSSYRLQTALESKTASTSPASTLLSLIFKNKLLSMMGAALVLFVLSEQPAAAQQAVFNGDFSTPVINNGGTSPNWISSGLNLQGGYQTSGGNLGAYFYLNNSGYTSPGPAIQQTITLIPGQCYDLTGDYVSVTRNSDPASATNSFTIDVNGSLVFAAGPTPTPLGLGGSWSHFNLCFTATAASTILRIRGETNNSDNDFGVDNVSVIQRSGSCVDRLLLNASPGVISPGQPVTITASVIGNSPTGMVQFAFNGTDFSSPVQLINGVAMLTTTSFNTVGTVTITAVYFGDVNNAGGGTTNPFVETILPPPPTAPIATGVNITGTLQLGSLLTGNYTYSDVNGDPQGTSTFRWLRNGVAIAGATASTYALVAADQGKTITFEVTPVATVAPTTGTPVISAAVVVPPPTTPTATGVNIIGTLQVGSLLTGNYTYSDVNGDPQGISTFRWLRNGVAIAGATAITYTVVAADQGTTITFEVTPVATVAPTTGVPVTGTFTTPGAGNDVPTLPEWGLIVLFVLLFLFGLKYLPRSLAAKT